MDQSGGSAAVAWGDESIRMRNNPPMYLMCATTFGEGAAEGLAAYAKAKPPRMRKLHWHDMDGREKGRSLEALKLIPQWSTVAVASPMYASIRPERGRRKCLERLLPHLESLGVRRLILESRWKQEDEADLDMVFALQNRKMIEHIRVEHMRPDEGEARLWVHDQILGAAGDILCGTDDMRAWGNAWNEIDSHVTILMATLI